MGIIDVNLMHSELNVGLTPLTASEQEKQYVSLTLVIRINPGITRFKIPTVNQCTVNWIPVGYYETECKYVLAAIF